MDKEFQRLAALYNQGLLKDSDLMVFSNKVRYPIQLDGDNRNLTIEQLIKKAKLCWVNQALNNRNFPLTFGDTADNTVRVCRLFTFPYLPNTNDVLNFFKKMDIRPATIHELLLFAQKYPAVQNIAPIVALGSVHTMKRGCSKYAPVLSCDNNGNRFADLAWMDCRAYYDGVQFLAVEK